MARAKRGKGNPFWIGFSDLMTSLFFVFLVVASFLAFGYRAQAEINATLAEANAADAKELARIRSIARAADQLEANGRFFFNEAQSRYELKSNFQFDSVDATIPVSAHAELIAAGRDIEQVLKTVSDTTDVRFKVVIEGRTARFLDKARLKYNKDNRNVNKNLSYDRALALATLWEDAGINLKKYNTELFVAGAGFEGRGRYPMVAGQEELNKQMIVQVIPFLVARD